MHEIRGTTFHADLVLAKDANGDWQTLDIDRALAVSAAKSVVDQMNHSLPRQAASNPD